MLRKAMKNRLWQGVKYFSIISLLIFLSVWLHEYVHHEIYRIFGCDDITIRSYIFVGTAKCLDEGRMMTEAEALVHSINEIVTYNIGILLMLLLVVFFMFRIKEM
jgi:hypothetical protein